MSQSAAAARHNRPDVRDRAAYPGLAEALAGKALDLLVANAGVGGPADSLDAPDAAGWLETLEVNTVAPVLLAAALRRHVARGHGRKVVGITSGLGSVGDNRSGGHLAYRALNAGLNMAFRTLAILHVQAGLNSPEATPETYPG